MVGLETWQFEILADTIYKIDTFDDKFEFIHANIFIDGGGEVSIYTSEETPSTKNDMYLEHEKIKGHEAFELLPNYIYIEVTLATVDKIILTGVKPTAI